jgi:hypothetical protein
MGPTGFTGPTGTINISGVGTGSILLRNNTGGINYSNIASINEIQMDISGNIVPTLSNVFSLGLTGSRWKEVFMGPGSLNIAGPSGSSVPATIGSNLSGIAYSQFGFASPFLNVGPNISATAPLGTIGGWQISGTGPTGGNFNNLVTQLIDNTTGGLTGPIYSLLGNTGPTGPTGIQGTSGSSTGLLLYLNQSQTPTPAISTYKLLSLILSTAAQQTVNTSIGSGATVNVTNFANQLTNLNNPLFIPPGIWEFNIFAAAVTNQDQNHITLSFRIYGIDSSGNETPLAGPSSSVLITNTTTQQYSCSLEIPYISLSGYVSLVVKVFATNNDNATRSINTFYEGATSYSHIHSSFGVLGNTGPTGQTGNTGPTGSAVAAYWSPTGPTGIYYNGGNVGIGNTSPTFILDVTGNARFTQDCSINSLTVGRGGGNQSSNTVLGSQALQNNTGGINNTAIGFNALQNNLSGDNTAIGYNALQANIGGPYNVAVGSKALESCTGQSNIAIGSSALGSNTSGSNNVAVGHIAGSGNIDGSYNTFIGYFAHSTDSSYINSTALGYQATIDASNQIVLGNGSITSLKCEVGLTIVSDRRDKSNFEPLDAGLNFINEINPVRFDWKQRGGGLEGRKDVGFTAQDLLEVQEKTNITIPNLVDVSNPDKYCILNTQLLPVMVKAIQDLNNKNKELDNKNKELENRVKMLEDANNN